MEKFAGNSCSVSLVHFVLVLPNSSVLAVPADLLHLADRTGSSEALEAHEIIRLPI
jgi:hypothetical protein